MRITTAARFAALPLAAAAVCGLAACGAASAPQPGSAAQPTRAAGHVVTAHPGPTIGLLPAASGLSDRLVLSRTTVPAGTPIKGTLVVTYQGSRALNLTRACQPQFAVTLTNGAVPPRVIFPAFCLNRPFWIRPGVNRLPFTLHTGFQSCAQNANSKPGQPKCQPGLMLMPPLPSGHYRAVLVGSGLALPPPAPVPVTLLPPSQG